MTFTYNIKVERCIGSCNNITNAYSKICLPDIIKNVTVKVFNLISQQNETKRISSHESCKCDCLLNKTACNDKQKWNSKECKCKSLKIERCEDGFVWNVSNCKSEQGKKAARLRTKKCVEIIDDITTITQNQLVENCKPFAASSISFLLVTIILTGLLIYFYVKSKPYDVLPYQNSLAEIGSQKNTNCTNRDCTRRDNSSVT